MRIQPRHPLHRVLNIFRDRLVRLATLSVLIIFGVIETSTVERSFLAHAQIVQTEKVRPGYHGWHTEATLSYQGCLDDTGQRQCSGKRQRGQADIVWNTNATPRQIIVPTQKIRFGPFHLRHHIRYFGPPNSEDPATRFHIAVWARSPAVYSLDGKYRGAKYQLEKIGEVTETLKGREAEKDVYISVSAPGVFTAFQLRASINGDLKRSSFPAECTNLPSSAVNPGSVDTNCLQSAVNPLAVYKLPYVPVAILYEPPGNCSWSNMTSQHTQGAMIGLIRGSGTTRRTITDAGFFWDVEHSDFTAENLFATDRRTQVRLSSAVTHGTRQAGSPASPGNPKCSDPNETVPQLSNTGPGRGDLFVMIRNPSMIYWDTDNLANATFSPTKPPGEGESVFAAFADQIRTGEGISKEISFTEEEKQAILAMNPLVDLSPGASSTEPPSRFILIDVYNLSQGVPLTHMFSQDLTFEGGSTLTQTTKRLLSSHDSEFIQSFSMKAIAYGASRAVESGAQEYLPKLGGDFKDLADVVEDVTLPQFYKDESTTNVTIQYSKSSLMQNTADTTVTQQIFVQNTLRPMDIGIYFDPLFGSYAVLEHPAGVGAATDPNIKDLPRFPFYRRSAVPVPTLKSLPREILQSLTRLGAISLVPASTKGYRSAWKVTKGSKTRSTQKLFIAYSPKRKPLAQVWLNVDPR